jgi:hypothetical protein
MFAGRDIDLLAGDPDAAADALAVGPSEDAHGELGPSRAHQAGDPDDLPRPEGEAHVADHRPVGVDRVVDRPAGHLHQHVADPRLAGRIAVRHRAADHAADDAVLVDRSVLAIQGLDRRPVAQDGDPVGHPGDLVEFVRDQDRRDSLCLEAAKQAQQRLAVGLAEARSRLVEDQQLHRLGERLGDLHQLLLADADIGDERVGILVEPHERHQCAGADVDPVLVDDPEPCRLVAQNDVLCDRQVRHQGELLVDDHDAPALAVGDVAEVPGLALVDDLARVGSVRIDAAQDFHQGRLARAILAHEGMDLGGRDGQIDVAQRLHARKRLRDAPHFEDGLHGTSSSSFVTRTPRADSAGAGTRSGRIASRPGIAHLSWSRV